MVTKEEGGGSVEEMEQLFIAFINAKTSIWLFHLNYRKHMVLCVDAESK
jgi:hypothetical protein